MSEGTPLHKELGQYNMYSVFQTALPWSDLWTLWVCSWLQGRDVQIFLLSALSRTLKSKSAFQINYVSFLSRHYLSSFNAVVSVAPTASLFGTKSKGRVGLCAILRKGRIAGSPIEQFVAARCLTTGSKESRELRRMGSVEGLSLAVQVNRNETLQLNTALQYLSSNVAAKPERVAVNGK